MEDALNSLSELIREMLQEQPLDEFSGVGAIAGYTLPLGMKPAPPHAKKTKKRKGKKRLRESSIHNYFRYHDIDDSYADEECELYYNGIDALSKAFGLSKNPFGQHRDVGIKKAEKFLQCQLKYPHST